MGLNYTPQDVARTFYKTRLKSLRIAAKGQILEPSDADFQALFSKSFIC